MSDEKRKYIKGLILATAIITVTLILDLVTKAVTTGVHQELIPNFLYITSTKNYAAAFSFTFGLPDEVFRIFVIVFSFLVVAVMMFVLAWWKKKHILFTISLSLIIGGALGNNIIDRVVFGYVRDFVEIQYFGLKIFGSTSFAIFNIADAALVCGVIIMLVWVIFFYRFNDKGDVSDPLLVTNSGADKMAKKEFKPILPPKRGKPEQEPDDGKNKTPEKKPDEDSDKEKEETEVK